MKKFYTSLTALVLFSMHGIAQNVGINEDGSLPHPKAILDIKSANKGILIPRMSSADRIAMRAPNGLLVFDTTTRSFWYFHNPYPADTIGSIYWREVATGNNWAINGNNADDFSFIGTTNNKPLQIKVNSRPAGEIHPFKYNTFFGYQSGYYNSGPYADSTTANTAFGYYTLHANRSGSHNTALGQASLTTNTTGHNNTATGTLSLLKNTTGNANTATGGWALLENTTGVLNTACGYMALKDNTSGSNNTGIGHWALKLTYSGSNNTGLGSEAWVAADVSNATAIGARAFANASNKVRIGSTAVTAIEGQVPFTVPSDGRFKFGIKEDVKGLDFILQLRPVTYQFDVKRFETQIGQPHNDPENKLENAVMEASYKEAADIRRSGFIAQEVEKAADRSGYNFSGIIRPKSAQEHYSLSYEAFVVPLVKAVQELSARIENLEKENEKMKQLLNSRETN